MAHGRNGAAYYEWRWKWSRTKLQNQARSVPTWEKRFCWEVGSVPWKRVLKAKEFINIFGRVLEWNDSAGEEAFKKAKLRYWSKINGQPCKIPLPSPDMYIDKIDWNPEIDPALLQGLDDEDFWVDDQEEENNKMVIKGFEQAVQQIIPTGWTDYSELFDRKSKVLTGMVVGDFGF